MIRFLMGLSLVCFVIGCGEAETASDKPVDETPTTETDGGNSAAVETAEPAAGENVAATEEPAAEENVAATEEAKPKEQAEKPAEPTIVKIKVPGMT